MNETDFYPEILHPHDPRFTPLPPPTQDVCEGPVFNVCVNVHWWSHLSGVIARLQYRDAWAGTEDEIDRAVESITKILNVGRPTMGCGCGDSGLLSQVTADGVFQTSNDGGVTWVDAPQLDPRNSATLPPPLGGADGADKRCKAANNVVRQMKDAREKFSNDLGTGKTILELAFVIAGAIAGVIFTGGSLAPILIPIVVGLATAIVTLTKAGYDDLFTSDVWDYALCQFYCGAGADGSFTQASFNTIRSNFDSHFSGNVALTFSSTLNGWQVSGLNSAARIPSTDSLDCSACPDCACPDECMTTWTWYGVHDVVFDGCNTYTMKANGTPNHVAFSSGDSAVGCYFAAPLGTFSYWPLGSGSPVGGTNPKTTQIWNADLGADYVAETVLTFVFSSAPIT